VAYSLKNLPQVEDQIFYSLSEISDIIGISRRQLWKRRKVMENHFQAKGNGKIPLRLEGRLWKHVLTSEATYREGAA
jgi:hypothetical protein